MDKLKLAQWGERLKTGGAQMSRLVSDKVKEMLQTPTVESKMVDDATSERMEVPNWGVNLRICGMINSEELNGTEVVRAIKKKIMGKSWVSQRLSLELLEVCAMNCEKVFSEVASEKVLDEMVRMIESPVTDQGNKDRALQLIRAWGQAEDLEYLPVFRQTYMILEGRSVPQRVEDGNSPPLRYSPESYVHEQPLSPPERYPIPETGFNVANHTALRYSNRSLSIEEKNECLVTSRNSLELLSSILNAETEPKSIKGDLTVSLFEKCKQSQAVLRRVIESTINDEAMLFGALSLNDELQQVISQYEKLEASLRSKEHLPERSYNSKDDDLPAQVEQTNENRVTDPPKEESTTESSNNKTIAE